MVTGILPVSGMFPVTNYSSNTTFSSSDGRFRMVIGNCQLERLHAHCAASYPLETGGVLTGYYNAGHDTAIITRATEPPPDSQSGRTRFYRGTQGLNNMMEHLWENGEYYLGEWHYHPNGSAYPSGVDISQMREIAKDSAARCPEPILLIIGTNCMVAAHVFFADEPSFQILR